MRVTAATTKRGRLRMFDIEPDYWLLTVVSENQEGLRRGLVRWKWGGRYNTKEGAIAAAEPHLAKGLDCNIEAMANK